MDTLSSPQTAPPATKEKQKCFAQPSQSTPVYNPNQKDDLHTEGIEKLTAAGVASNWMDRLFMMETCIGASIYAYVMKGPVPDPPPPMFKADKAKTCGMFARYVTQPNLSILHLNCDDPVAMWRALKEAHQGNTAGSQMYWLEKLVTFKMESNDVQTELNRLFATAERLNALISTKRPLTVDKILSMVVCLMLPPLFKPTVTPLLQHESVNSTQIITAI